MITNTTWFVLLIIFPALMALFFIYQLISTHFIKKREARLKVEQQEIRDRVFLESLIIIEIVVELNESALKNFVPSLSDTKMFQIQQRSKEILNYFFLKNKFFFSFILLLAQEESFIEKLVKKMHKVKSNLWEKYLVEEFRELREKVEEAKDKDLELCESLRLELLDVVKTKYYDQKAS